MNYQKLDPRAPQLWRAVRLLGLVALALLGSGIYSFLVLVAGLSATGRWTTWFFVIFGGLLILQSLNLLLYPPIEYRQWAYAILPDRIETRHGIVFHTTRIVPISRIQHVTIHEGPLDRRFGLAAVTIHTAGGTVQITGLARETAAQISNGLKTTINQKVRPDLVRPQAEGVL
jgi:membrane protein YdbS with pleckstrin-like domain